jgi:hypothetical protein
MLLVVEATTFEPLIMCCRGIIRNKNLGGFAIFFSTARGGDLPSRRLRPSRALSSRAMSRSDTVRPEADHREKQAVLRGVQLIRHQPRV